MKKKRTFQPILVFIAIGFLLYGSYAVCTSVSQKKYKRAEISENDKEINLLKKDVERLEEEISESDTTQYIEKVAREDFGMVKPREIIYVDKDKRSNNSNLQEISE